MKPDEFAASLWFRKVLEVAVVGGAEQLVPEVPGVIRGVSEGGGCRRPLDRDEPGGLILIPLALEESLECVDVGGS